MRLGERESVGAARIAVATHRIARAREPGPRTGSQPIGSHVRGDGRRIASPNLLPVARRKHRRPTGQG